jgi:glycosyltransferase involved in cell wall biosynthesis
MRISVVIPSFNSGRWLPDALASVFTQTRAADQVIVVDDGSTDDTQDRLAGYRDRLMYTYQANAGVASARNNGIHRAVGDWIAFLDADDVWHPRKLEMQLAALADRPDLGLLGARTFVWPAEAMPDLGSCPSTVATSVAWSQLLIRNYFTTSAVIVRRSIFDEIGYFDTQLQGPEDHDLWLRIAAVTATANLELPLTGYRSLPGSLSRQADTMERGMCRILHKLDAEGAWKDRWSRHKAYGYCRFSCAFMHWAAGRRQAALGRLLGSFAWYPWAFGRTEVPIPWARWRMLRRVLTGRLPT